MDSAENKLDQVGHPGGATEVEELIAFGLSLSKAFHACGQGHTSEQIVVDVERFQRRQALRQVEVGSVIIASDNERGQIRQAARKENVDESIGAEVEKSGWSGRRQMELVNRFCDRFKTAQKTVSDPQAK